MTCKGRVAGGVVVLESPGRLPEGVAVSVRVLGKRARAKRRARKAPPDIWSKLLDLAGTAKGLPSDLARNHDHYAHGAPKR